MSWIKNTLSVGDVKDPPEEVLSPSDIEWEEGETSLSYLGDNGEMYTVYREPQTKVLCNHDQDGLETHPGYPDPDESGPQLKENPEQGKTPVNPEPSELNSPWIHWSHSQRKALNKVSF